MANGLFGGGNGSKKKPYLIEDGYDFNELRNIIGFNHYRQANDIDMTVITDYKPFPFIGVYDGRYKKITKLECRNPRNAAIFTSISGVSDVDGKIKRSEVKRVVAEKSKVDSVDKSGASLFVSGSISKSTVRDCAFSGELRGGGMAGFAGIIGDSALIERCCIKDTVFYINKGYAFSGFTHNGSYSYIEKGRIKDCYVEGAFISGSVTVQKEIAPFVASGEDLDIENCYSSVASSPLPNGEERRTILFGIDGDTGEEVTALNSYADTSIKYIAEMWDPESSYQGNARHYVRGKDGLLYYCIKVGNQHPFHIGAEPGVGSNWREYWVVIDSNNSELARSAEEMADVENYIDWDFENVWNIENALPFLRFQRIPTESETKCERINITKLLGGY